MATDVLGLTQSISGALFNSPEFVELIKIVFVVIEVIYVFFALVVVRQVALMNKTFKTGSGFVFAVVSWAHFFAIVLLIFLTIILLP